MNRKNRIALLAAAVLLLVAAGGVMANRSPIAQDLPAAPASSHEPESEEADAPPTAEDLAHAGDRLAAGGIPFDDAVLADLAARYGMGGAVRLLAWSAQTQMDVEELAALRDGTDTEPGLGWGRIAKDLELHPGLGSIMGNGHGRDNAPGQQKKAPEE